jgi:outer membrane protein assembly factor BamB
MVYAASYDGFLYALDPDLGHPAWRTQVGASVYSSPAIAGNKLFLGTNQGRFLALFLGR